MLHKFLPQIKSQATSFVQITLARFGVRSQRFRLVLLGSGTLLASTIINQFGRIAMVALLARYYTKEEFGVWVVITSTTAVLMISDFGIGNALRNKLSGFAAKGKEGDAQAREHYLSIFYFFLVIGLLLSLLLIIISKYIPVQTLFKTSNEELQQSGVKILLSVQLMVIMGIPFGVGVVAFFSYQESYWCAVVGMAQALLSFGAVVCLVLIKASIVSIAISYFVVGLLVSMVGTIIFLRKRKWNPLHVKTRLILPRVMGLLPLSLRFFILQVSYAFILNAPTIVLSATVGVADAAEYNLVQKLNWFALGLYMSMFNPLWAGYADAASKNDWLWCKKTLKVTLIMTVVIFGMLIFVMLGAGNFALSLLAGKKYVSGQLLFLLMGLWALANAVSNCAALFQNALGRISLMTILTILLAIIAVPLLSGLGRNWGLNGIVVGTLFLVIPGAVIVPLQAFSILKTQCRLKQEGR